MTTPTAVACKLCGTIEGYVHPRTGEPTRTRHLCEACYIRERRAGRLDRWPIMGPGRPSTLAARTCVGCAATFWSPPSSPRVYCSWRCYLKTMRDGKAAIPTGLITLASRGIRNDIPPIDANLTPRVVGAIANLNARRATAWLKAHGHTDLATLVTTIWEPATNDAAQVAA